MKHKTYTLVILCLLCATLNAQIGGTCGDSLTWNLTGESLTISGTGDMRNFSWAAEPWYSYRNLITTVVIDNGVTSIGDNAFNGCSALASISIGNSVISIGENVFYSCSGLSSITIPNSVTSIGYAAFFGCIGLTSPIYNSHVFAYMPTTYSGAYDIPDGIESLGSCAFYNCSGLTSVTIPNSVTSIGSYAFYSCSGLTSIIIPHGVTSIEKEAFSCSTQLDTLYSESSTPPQLGNFALANTSHSLKIFVPCGTLEAYLSAGGWEAHASKIRNQPSATIQTAPLVEGTGQVNVPQTLCDTILEAIPADGYYFVKWTDGNIDNPRTIDPKVEATYIAEFAIISNLNDIFDENDFSAKKAFVNGHLYILLSDGTCYDATGRKVD